MNILRIIALLLIIFNFNTSEYTLAQNDDLLGWNGLEWGMNWEEIQQIIDKKIEKINSNVLAIKSVNAFDNTFEVRLSMKNDSLSKITFNLDEEPNKALYYKLEEYLSKDYGPPSEGNTITDVIDISSRKWIFKTTTIELKFVHLTDSAILNIIFYPTESEDKEYIAKKEKAEKIYDFRKTFWGMSKSEVKQNEDAYFEGETERILKYSTVIDNEKVILIYGFIDDKLIDSTYFFQNKYINPNKYITDYERINKFLISKYGNTNNELDEKEWSNTLFKSDPENWGLAVSMGQLLYVNYWITYSTRIGHMLTGENYKVRHTILYTSTKLHYLHDEKEIKKRNEQL